MHDIAVLGPVHLAGEPVRGRLAALAVVLTLASPRVVPQEDLVSRVLGGRRTNDLDELRVLMSRLRRRLRDRGSPATVVHEHVGYALHDASTDAAEFDALVDEGFALRLDRPVDAEACLVRALSLWRGDVLDEFADDPAVGRLRERRIAALVARFELALDQGRHAPVLADLLAACREFTYDEELHRSAMVTLYRCGRQSDALTLYRDLRARLVEDLGVEPGERLRATELQILRQAPELAGPLAASAPGVHRAIDRSPLVWAAAPPTYGDSYVPHEAAPALRAVVDHEVGVVSVVGPAGVGKTRLVVEVLRDAATDREEAAFCELSATDEATLALTVAAAVGARVPPNADAVEAIGQHLALRRWVVVLDTCEHLRDAVSSLVERLLARAPSTLLVATSRIALDVSGERLLTMAPLPPADAARLFVDRSRQAGSALADGEVAVDLLCRRLDGLPLAIELAASRTRAFSAPELLDLLDRRLTLLAREPDEGRTSGLRASLEWSYSLLSDDERRVFRAFGAFAGPVPLDALASVARNDGEVGDTAVALAALVDYSLVVPRRAGAVTRFTVLDSTRAFSRALLDESGQWPESRLRHAAWVEATKDGLLPRTWGPEEPAAVAALEQLRPELRIALPWAIASGHDDVAARLLAGLGESALLREWTEVRGWADAVVASPVTDVASAAATRAVAAVANWTHGDFVGGVTRTDEAWALVASHAVEPTTDFFLAAVINAGARDMATFAEQAREVAGRAMAYRHGLGQLWALNGEGMAHAYHGRFAAALEVLAVAEVSARQVGSRSQLAMAQFARTIALLDDDPAGALGAADECLAHAAEVRASWLVGAVSNYRAAALVRAGQPDVAVAEVRDLCRRLAGGGTVQSAANTVRNAIALLDRLGHPIRALSLLGWLDANPVGIPGTPGMRAHVDRLRARLDDLVPAGVRAAALAEGASWSHGEVVAVIGRLLTDLR